MMWPGVIGQERVKEVLLSALRSNRLPHAYLFHGGEGVGKDAMALQLAKVLHCEREGEEACGVCASCTKMASLQHPDVRVIVALPVGKGEQSDDPPMAKLTDTEVKEVQEQLRLKAANPYHRIAISRATVIKINSIREVRRESSLATSDRRKRVFVISEADMMGDAAANTLLKTLEEPPGDTMLILTTAHREALLPTIVSRCQSVRFDPLTEEELQRALVERSGVEPDRAALGARLANGSYTRALDLLGTDIVQQRIDVLSFIRHTLAANALPLMEDIEAIAQSKDRDRTVRFLVLMLMWFRDALVLLQEGRIINLDQEDDLRRFAAKFPGADLVRVLADVERAISLVERNVYIKLVLLHLAMHLKENIAGREEGRPAGVHNVTEHP